MIDKTNLKRTKRILKELGIYSEFIRERKKYILSFNMSVAQNDSKVLPTFFLDIYTLYKLLFISFTWSKTENPLLWETLYNKLVRCGMSNKEILNSNDAIKELKKIVKNTQK